VAIELLLETWSNHASLPIPHSPAILSISDSLLSGSIQQQAAARQASGSAAQTLSVSLRENWKTK